MLNRADLDFLETVLQSLPAMWTKQTKLKQKKHCIQNNELTTRRHQFLYVSHELCCSVLSSSHRVRYVYLILLGENFSKGSSFCSFQNDQYFCDATQGVKNISSNSGVALSWLTGKQKNTRFAWCRGRKRKNKRTNQINTIIRRRTRRRRERITIKHPQKIQQTHPPTGTQEPFLYGDCTMTTK